MDRRRYERRAQALRRSSDRRSPRPIANWRAERTVPSGYSHVKRVQGSVRAGENGSGPSKSTVPSTARRREVDDADDVPARGQLRLADRDLLEVGRALAEVRPPASPTELPSPFASRNTFMSQSDDRRRPLDAHGRLRVVHARAVGRDDEAVVVEAGGPRSSVFAHGVAVVAAPVNVTVAGAAPVAARPRLWATSGRVEGLMCQSKMPEEGTTNVVRWSVKVWKRRGCGATSGSRTSSAAAGRRRRARGHR